MSVTITELHPSREGASGRGGSIDLIYKIEGTADDATARAALLAVAPTTHDGLRRKANPRVRPIRVDVDNDAWSVWEGTVTYVDASRARETGDASFSFDATGGTQHITQSLETVGAYGPPGSSVDTDDHGGAIGVDGQSVKGVDIPVPSFAWQESHILSGAYCTWAYRRAVALMRGKVNDSSFRGFDAGEVLFLGTTGEYRPAENDWDLVFHFDASANVRDETIGEITGIQKEGWQYLWVQYGDAETGDGNPARQPVGVYVERVLKYADFSQLGIGTGVPDDW